MRKLLLLALLAVGICGGVRADVVIESQPQSPVPGGGQIPLGNSFVLTVRATGKGPLTYQWRRNGANVPGETNFSLQFSKFVFTDGGAYSVAVSDAIDTVVSVPVLLVPAVRPLPFIDDFPPTSKNLLEGDSGNGVGSNAQATVQRSLGEPFHAGEPGGASVWVEWRPTQTGIAQFATIGSDIDTLLAVYVAGEKPDLVSLISVESNDEIGLYHNSLVQFNVTANQLYYIAVDGKGAATPKGGRGDIVLAWALTPSTFLLPVFTFQPPDANHAPGETFDLSVNFTPPKGSTTTVQWYRNGVPIKGATSPTLPFKSISPKEVGRHFARIISTLKETQRILDSKPTDIQIYRRKDNTDNSILARDFYLKSQADGQASKQGGGGARPASLSHGIPLSLARGISGTQVFNTTGASSDAGEPMICGVPGGASEWYSILCADAGTVVVDTQGSSFDTLLGAYFDTGAGEDIYDGLVEVACNNDISKDNHASRIAFTASASRIYSLDMDGVGGSTGIVQLNYALYAPLKILAGPTDQTVSEGSTVVFTVSTQGYVSSYQWLKDGAPISGETGSTLTLTGVTPADDAGYSVMVDNEAGEGATSASATLTVQAAPQITGDPASQTVSQGDTASFTVTATGTGPLAYQWRKGGMGLAGKTSATLSLTGAQQADEGSYDCVVSNVVGTATSNPATLTVRVPPAVTGDPASQTVNPGDPVSFTVTATGTGPLGYQWRKGGQALSGKTAATLSIASCVAGDAGSYDCVVTNLAGTATSGAATLTVRVPPSVTGDPASQTVNPGDPVSFTVTATGTGPLGYQWRKGGMDLSGKTAATLTIASCVADDAGSYDCVVSNLAGTDTSAAATLTVRTLPTITTAPASRTIVQDNPVTFNVVAAGTGPLAYQWQRATTNLPGATGASYSIPSVV
ncbi:MAG TPA: immunoglobulin domain-containing protein, partial [Candidatus Limnocylindria bacterium]|nr:immunoglobulin domain-containing protein [Candidatus Limnocylindria bacterium]